MGYGNMQIATTDLEMRKKYLRVCRQAIDNR